MKIEFRNSWMRLPAGFFPWLPTIRRYRVVPRSLDGPTRRLLYRRILRQLRRSRQEVA